VEEMIYVWIASHIILGILAALFLPVWGLVGFAFWMREMGELKHQIPGSITTLEKNLTMVAASVVRGRVLAQWLLPMVAAYAVLQM
jgi:hypothetical protein